MILNNKKGQALVEVALALLFLLLPLVFGSFEFGRAMYIRNTLNYAAREGARTGSVSNPWNAADVRARVTASLPASLRAGLDITITPPAPLSGNTVTVVVRAPFATVVPDLLTQLAGITTLSAEASMRYE